MLIELQRPPLEDAQALPHGITSLHHTVEHADLGLSAGYKSVHPDKGLHIAWVRLVEFCHGISSMLERAAIHRAALFLQLKVRTAPRQAV